MDRINDLSAPNKTFLDADLINGVQGSIVRAPWTNGIQEELAGGLIEYAGLTPNAADNTQVRQAIKLIRGFSVTTRSFTASQIYYPPARLAVAFVEVQAPGGGGGACPNSSGGLGGGAGGGGGGGYISGWLAPPVIGASQAITIGAPGLAGLVGFAPTAGGATAFGGYLSAAGGTPGSNAPASSIGAAGIGGSFSFAAGPTVAKAKFGRHGAAGTQGTSTNSSGIGGTGGDAELGFGGAQGFATDAPGGRAPDGQDYGGGGAGAGVSNVTVNGGNGAPAIVRVTEYTWNL